MAEYGLETCTELVEVTVPMGRMMELLDLDVGHGPHIQSLEIFPNYGEGEIVDGPVPQKTNEVMIDSKLLQKLVARSNRLNYIEGLLKRKNMEFQDHECMKESFKKPKGITIKEVTIEDAQKVEKVAVEKDYVKTLATSGVGKGKGKLSEDTMLTNNGVWTAEALEMFEKGKQMSKKFGKMVVNLEDKISDSLTVEDWIRKELKAKWDTNLLEGANIMGIDNPLQLEGDHTTVCTLH